MTGPAIHCECGDDRVQWGARAWGASYTYCGRKGCEDAILARLRRAWESKHHWCYNCSDWVPVEAVSSHPDAITSFSSMYKHAGHTSPVTSVTAQE